MSLARGRSKAIADTPSLERVCMRGVFGVYVAPGHVSSDKPTDMLERPLPCCMCARVCPSFYAQARILAHSRSTPKLLMTNPNLCKLPRPNLKPLSVTDSKSPEEGAHMVLSSYEPHRQYHHHHTTPLTAFPNATSLVHHDRASVIDADTSPL